MSQKKREKRESQHLDPETNSCSVPFNYVANVLTASLGFPYNKPTRCTNFSNLFWNETLHVSDISSVHHQDTQHSTMVYVLQVYRQLSSSRIRMELQFRP
jgi:hypothetical protein